MKVMKIVSILAIGLFLSGGVALAADIAATLTVGEETGGPGATVSVPVTISGDQSKAAGLAVTLTYDTDLTFAGLEQVDPQAISDPDAEGLTDDDVVDSTLYYQANDDGAGTVKIAAAAATAVVTGVVFNAKFTIPADAAADAEYVVDASQTSIVNEAAGYPEGSDPLEVLCGVPDATGAVTDTFTTTLAPGKITASNPCKMRGDLSGDGQITTADALQILLYLNGYVDQAKLEEFCDADLDTTPGISTSDALRILLFLNGYIDSI